MTSATVEVRNVPISCARRDEAIAEVRRLVETAGRSYVCCAPVHLVEVARRDPHVQRALHEATLVLPDGAPVAWTARILSGRPVDRVCGSDVFDALVLRAKPGYRHFFYGASQEVLNRLEAQLRQRAPQAVIAGRYSPPFRQLSAAERRRDTAMINAAKPDIVWVGLGAPKQELWIAETRRLLDAPLVVGVGAVFDFVAGTKRRAPHVLQVIGLEWLHRLMSEPRRLASRYLTTNATFVLGVSKSLICRRGSGK